MIRGATGEVEEINFGYPLGLVEIVICWRGQVKPPGNSPPSTLTLFSHLCIFQFFRIDVRPRRDKSTIQSFPGRFLARRLEIGLEI